MAMSNISEKHRLGFAYVPYQKYNDLYNMKTALQKGTLFKELDIPFEEYAENPIMNPFK